MAINRKITVTDYKDSDTVINIQEYSEGIKILAKSGMTGRIELNISTEDAAVLGKWLQEVSE